ncbi:hypothetical protein CN378_19715 [Bacillus sp. AFS015802]|uniref:ABC transporter permease subunit n=1 Tax=Bacillus sp. AFS015802 TaxID=2033486 RepID=UPI000BF2BA60|nr:ABC transporter permease subunit [Bacillus sp. AFS015802]PFA63246.1 hypothetical protein CN378_19715 [Bacillus sp. AFS015802]
MVKFIKGLGLYGLTCTGIILILASPALIVGLNGFSASALAIIKGILQPHALSYYVSSETLSFGEMPEVRSVEFHQQQVEGDLFPYILDSYFYSMSLLFGSFLLAVIVSSFAGLLYIQSHSFMKKMTLTAIGILESLPDVFFIFSIQLVVVWFYKQTGIEPAAPYSTSDKQAYVLPLLISSIVPSIYLWKVLILFIKEESEKDYVVFAKSKGLSGAAISFRHIFRNTALESVAHLPLVILTLLTNLIVIEYLFHSSGIMGFIMGNQPASSRAFMLILLMTPLYLLVQGANRYRQRFYETRGGGIG